MGCNESKQAVATTNAISRRSFRRKSSSVKPKDTDDAPVPREETNHPTVPTDQPAEPAAQLNENDNNVDEVKNVDVATETTETKDKVENSGIMVVEHHRTVSLDDYFSMRKDEDPAESEDGYYSPTRDPVKDVESTDEREQKEGDLKEEVKGELVVQEEKSLAEEADTTSLIKEDEKGKLEEVEEPKVVEEITVEQSEDPVVVTGTAWDLAAAALTTATPETATTMPETAPADESDNLTKSEEPSSDSPGKEVEAK